MQNVHCKVDGPVANEQVGQRAVPPDFSQWVPSVRQLKPEALACEELVQHQREVDG